MDLNCIVVHSKYRRWYTHTVGPLRCGHSFGRPILLRENNLTTTTFVSIDNVLGGHPLCLRPYNSYTSAGRKRPSLIVGLQLMLIRHVKISTYLNTYMRHSTCINHYNKVFLHTSKSLNVNTTNCIESLVILLRIQVGIVVKSHSWVTFYFMFTRVIHNLVINKQWEKEGNNKKRKNERNKRRKWRLREKET